MPAWLAPLAALVVWALSQILKPPEMPHIRVLPGTYYSVKSALELFYYRGALDGFMLGALTAILIYPRIRRGAASNAKADE